MDFQYVAYTKNRKMVKGKLSAVNQKAAIDQLTQGDLRVINLKQVQPLISAGIMAAFASKVKQKEIIMFSRQLALLLESGTDVITALELLRSQVTSRTLKPIIAGITDGLRGGASLSTALSRYPDAFSQVYHRAIAAGEQSGNIEVVLRQMADYMERSALTRKKVKAALQYPIIVAVVALGVVVLMVTFVLPTFMELYASFGAEMPPITKMVMAAGDWSIKYGLQAVAVLVVAVILIIVYSKTPGGKRRVDRLLIKSPIIGRIAVLNELSRCCRTMALLFRVGLALPEIMSQVSQGTNNTAMAEALTGVQNELIRGEGLSTPMSRRSVFLPLMVQMVKVGEETGKLDSALTTVAQSYEAEADDRTAAAVGLLQPAITVVIAAGVGVIALSMVSAMYSIYGQISP